MTINDGTLASIGGATPVTVGSVTANNGGILGSTSTPGIIDTADLNLQAGSTFDEPINGPTPGIGYSQVVSSGPVMLTGSTLNVTLGYTPAFGASYDILQNTSGSPVIGTFNDLPEGASITVRSYKFFITYHGGTSGDDVVLNTVQPSPTTITSVSGIDSFATLHTFSGGTNGLYLYGGIIEDAAGDLFGTTRKGGTYDDGTVFELPAGSYGTPKVLATFSTANGIGPVSALVMDAQGNLFGTTSEDTSTGATITGYGSVFPEGPGNERIYIQPLATFNDPDGSPPLGSLILDSSGDLFGHFAWWGQRSRIVFELTKGSTGYGAVALSSSSVSMAADRCSPFANLVMRIEGRSLRHCLAGWCEGEWRCL